MNDPREAGFEEANLQLVAGLKSCRSVVENYRAMLSGEQDEEQEAEGSAGAANGPEPGESRG